MTCYCSYEITTGGRVAPVSTILEIDQRLIEIEAEIANARFIKRFTLLWLSAGNLIILGGIIAGNYLIDFSHPGGGRAALNELGGLSLVISIIASAACWWHWRTQAIASTVDLHQREAERASLQTIDAGTADLPSTFHIYYESAPKFRDEYRRSAEKYRGRHNLFQLTVIIGSILTSVSTTASAEQGVWSWLAVGLSALVSISAGIIAYFKFRERSLNLQQTADSIDLEIQAYSLHIRRYKNLAPEEASTLFAEEVERIREEQRKKELQLEQPPEATSDHRPQLA
ncbi:DUF4231 domain-containing protein [Streptomyces sp. NK08204]|uniref:DUF4231 domain-containing protein n=1 Tax=Streptomyces sp. NK08204 TaxID=2873260 RepID=UPI001CECB738|nr:DUF4231 domain-containing protein [Streptomyces sp. NK08204]